MNVPNLPHPTTPISIPTGHIHPDWYRYFTQLTNEMQINLSQEGTFIPKQTSDNINLIQNSSDEPRFIYDSDNNVVKVSINGVFKTVNTT